MRPLLPRDVIAWARSQGRNIRPDWYSREAGADPGCTPELLIRAARVFDRPLREVLPAVEQHRAAVRSARGEERP